MSLTSTLTTSGEDTNLGLSTAHDYSLDDNPSTSRRTLTPSGEDTNIGLSKLAYFETGDEYSLDVKTSPSRNPRIATTSADETADDHPSLDENPSPSRKPRLDTTTADDTPSLTPVLLPKDPSNESIIIQNLIEAIFGILASVVGGVLLTILTTCIRKKKRKQRKIRKLRRLQNLTFMSETQENIRNRSFTL